MNTIAHVSLLLVSGIIMSACSDTSTTPAEQTVALKFAAVVGDEAFDCGTTYANVGVGLNDWKVTDFRFFVHDVRLRDPDSGEEYALELNQDAEWQYQNLALIDLEDGCGAGNAEMNDRVAGKISVPAGQTLDTGNVQACFVLGVPEALNHLDPSSAPSPLNSSGMLWAWKTGMKYLRVDGTGDPDGTPQGFNLHLGAQGCPTVGAPTEPPVSACTVPNTVEVCIDQFDIDHDVIAVDPKAVLVGNDVSANYSGAPG